MSRSLLLGALGVVFFLSGCASGTFKERQQKREQLAQAKGLYCDFISGDEFPDLDVELSMVMANKCDPSKPFTVSPYKNSSAKNGMIYCCSINRSNDSRMSSGETKRPAARPANSAVVPADSSAAE